MSVTDKLEDQGINIDTLNASEKETYFKMLEIVQKSQLTPEKLRDYVTEMKDAVAREISKEPAFIRIFIFKVENPKLTKLQARLENYLLLGSFLQSPQKAQEALDEMVGNIGRG
ncbi:MAG: hypothetical protein NUV69_00620 [Candidatus Curtissbacteria bacterium]|nr:hypothetical protein [Candidatus Curtissbacteria bacterium]